MAWLGRRGGKDETEPLPTPASGPIKRLSAVDGASFLLNLEPEGMEHELAGGTRILVTWPEGSQQVEVTWRPAGLVIFRDVQVLAYPDVRTEDGTVLDW